MAGAAECDYGYFDGDGGVVVHPDISRSNLEVCQLERVLQAVRGRPGRPVMVPMHGCGFCAGQSFSPLR